MLEFMVMILQLVAQQLSIIENINISLLFFVIGIVFIVGYYIYQQTDKTNNTVFSSSVLLSMHTNGLQLDSVAQGKLANGLSYNLMLTKLLPTNQQLGQVKLFSDSDSAIIDALTVQALQSKNQSYVGKIFMTLTLPARQNLHVACLGVPDNETRTNLDNELVQYNLEPVTLEGDFPNYFSLFTSPGSQSHVRELLDPSTMAFLVDYCKKQDWELIDNMLYFAQNNVNEKSDEPSRVDNTTMVQDAEEFAKIVLSRLSK